MTKCAWCNKIMEKQESDELTSHGICEECYSRIKKEIEDQIGH